MDETIRLEGPWTREPETMGPGEPVVLDLPGTADGAGLGTTTPPDPHRWTRDRDFVGVLKLSRRVEIPVHWAAGTVELFLERCHWITRVSVDGVLVSTADSLTGPHRHDLTGLLAPGSRLLTLEIDNRPWLPLEGSTHHLSKDTQGNWNGVIGRLALEHRDEVSLVSAALHPRVADRSVDVVVRTRNLGPAVSGLLILETSVAGGRLRLTAVTLDLGAGEEDHRVHLELGSDAPLWDEFSPVLHRLECRLEAGGSRSSWAADWGLREFRALGKRLTVNGRTVFLRGSHDACVFPLTGHPPMDVASWESLFRTYRNYGLNHFRAHSWCPPEACFTAADRLGIYLQVEGPAGGLLGLGQTAEGNWDPLMVSSQTQAYLRQELDRIAREYGNHPSLVMVSIGNELSVDQDFLNQTVGECRKDGRHLWASGSNNCWPRPRLGGHDDFFVAFMIDSWEGLLRGSYHLSHVGHINNRAPSTEVDYRRASAAVPVPVITHELGQYLAYPDYAEIDHYTGTMKAKHLEAFRADLAAHGLEGQDARFARASGALQVRLYKAEIEAALATPNLAGFQLLDLKDYPGQSVALCGVLDVFGRSKGSVTEAGWRAFCSSVVPLARFSRFVWTEGEIFEAEVVVAHYGPSDLPAAPVRWNLTDSRGRSLGQGLFQADLRQGTVAPVDRISLVLRPETVPGKLVLSIDLPGTEAANSWDLWVYPREAPAAPAPGVRVTTRWNRETEAFAAAGGRVLFLGDGSNLLHTHPGMFQTNFWTYRMFQCFAPPGTLGTVSDPDHPAFRHFPQDGHTDWQWFDIVKNSPAVEISWCDRRIRPLVQVIDTYERNLKLGILWEVGLGAGGVLISTLNPAAVARPSPAVDQWLASLLAYLGSPDFRPEVHLGESGRALDQVLKVVPDDVDVPVDRRE